MGVESVKAIAEKSTNGFWDWGVPLISGAIGYLVNDIFGLENKITGADKNNYNTTIENYNLFYNISNPNGYINSSSIINYTPYLDVLLIIHRI